MCPPIEKPPPPPPPLARTQQKSGQQAPPTPARLSSSSRLSRRPVGRNTGASNVPVRRRPWPMRAPLCRPMLMTHVRLAGLHLLQCGRRAANGRPTLAEARGQPAGQPCRTPSGDWLHQQPRQRMRPRGRGRAAASRRAHSRQQQQHANLRPRHRPAAAAQGSAQLLLSLEQQQQQQQRQLILTSVSLEAYLLPSSSRRLLMASLPSQLPASDIWPRLCSPAPPLETHCEAAPCWQTMALRSRLGQTRTTLAPASAQMVRRERLSLHSSCSHCTGCHRRRRPTPHTVPRRLMPPPCSHWTMRPPFAPI